MDNSEPNDDNLKKKSAVVSRSKGERMQFGGWWDQESWKRAVARRVQTIDRVINTTGVWGFKLWGQVERQNVSVEINEVK